MDVEEGNEQMASVHQLPYKSNRKFEKKRDLAKLRLEVSHTFGRHDEGNNHPYCPTCIKDRP